MATRMICFDTETTGFHAKAGHRIIEIGAVEFLDGSPTGNEFHVYLDPQRDIDKRAEEVHGISREMLKGKPRFADIAQDFIEFIKGATVVAHNLPFDESHINNEFSIAGLACSLESVAAHTVDSMDLAKELFPGKKLNLDALCDKLGVDRTQRTSHGALLDAKLLGEVTVALLEKKKIIQQVNEATRPSLEPISIQNYASVRFIAPDHKAIEHEAFLKKIDAKTQTQEDQSAPGPA